MSLKVQLMRASSAGNKEEIKSLLQSKADPSAVTKDGFTVLHLAALATTGDEIDQIAGIRLLVAKKADVASKDAFGNTALYYCVKYGRQEMAKAFLELGTVPEGGDIHIARSRGYVGLAELLEPVVKQREDLEKEKRALFLEERRKNPLSKYKLEEREIEDFSKKELRVVNCFFETLFTGEKDVLEGMNSQAFQDFLKQVHSSNFCLVALQAAAEAGFKEVVLRIMEVPTFLSLIKKYAYYKKRDFSERYFISRFVRALQIAVEHNHEEIFEIIFTHLPIEKESKPAPHFKRELERVLKLIGEKDDPQLLLSALKVLDNPQIFGMKFEKALEMILDEVPQGGEIVKAVASFQDESTLKSIFRTSSRADFLGAVMSNPKFSKRSLIHAIQFEVKDQQMMLAIVRHPRFKKEISKEEMEDILESMATVGWKDVVNEMVTKHLWDKRISPKRFKTVREAALQNFNGINIVESIQRHPEYGKSSCWSCCD